MKRANEYADNFRDNAWSELNDVVVTSGNSVVDGNHRTVAAILAGVPIRYIDLEDDPETLEEEDFPTRRAGPPNRTF